MWSHGDAASAAGLQVTIDRSALEALFSATQQTTARQIDGDDAGAGGAKTRKKNAVLSVLDAQVSLFGYSARRSDARMHSEARVGRIPPAHRAVRPTDRQRCMRYVVCGTRRVVWYVMCRVRSVRNRSGSCSLRSRPSRFRTSSQPSKRSMWRQPYPIPTPHLPFPWYPFVNWATIAGRAATPTLRSVVRGASVHSGIQLRRGR